MSRWPRRYRWDACTAVISSCWRRSGAASLGAPRSCAGSGRPMTGAFQFPGQGSQSVGMGRAFYDTSAAAKAVFEEADDALGFPLRRLIFEGPESELTLTANTQPAVLTASVAAAAACA